MPPCCAVTLIAINKIKIFKDEIFEIANNLKVDFNLYDLDGALIKKSKPTFDNDTITPCLSPDILNKLNQTLEKRYVVKDEQLGGDFQSSYTIFADKNSKPLGILNVPFFSSISPDTEKPSLE